MDLAEMGNKLLELGFRGTNCMGSMNVGLEARMAKILDVRFVWNGGYFA
jgi:hypothetical protein